VEARRGAAAEAPETGPAIDCFPPADFSICFWIFFRLNAPGVRLAGYSAMLCRNLATTAVAGNSMYGRSRNQSLYVFELCRDFSNGSQRRLNSSGTRNSTKGSRHTPNAWPRFSTNTAFQSSTRKATT
jgi:hypothetical protein